MMFLNNISEVRVKPTNLPNFLEQLLNLKKKKKKRIAVSGELNDSSIILYMLIK